MFARFVLLGACAGFLGTRTLVSQSTPRGQLRAPDLAAFGLYTRRMAGAYGTTGPLTRCRFGTLSLDAVDSIRLRWPHHWLTLPSGFKHGPMRLRYDSTWHPMIQQRWLGQEWLPGLLIEPVDWYRWTRPHPDARSLPDSPGTLVQLRDDRDYPVVLAEHPWTVTNSEECEWETLGEGARVMRYTLVHPDQPTQWVLTASWYGRREDGSRGFLSIGPDEASQAEALEILRRLRHDDPQRGIVLQGFERGASAVRVTNPDVSVQVDVDSVNRNERVLLVKYPPPSDNPAARDIWIDVSQKDWSRSRAIEFEARSEHPTRLSVSFLDGNRVAYTSWSDLDDTGWQTVRVVFGSIRPNPYFQPPGARTDSKLDVREVSSLGLAPQDKAAGTLWIRKLRLVR